MMMGFGGIWFIFLILIIIGIVMLVVWVLKKPDFKSLKEGNGKSSFEILKERYARGEITKKEFETMKKDIS